MATAVARRMTRRLLMALVFELVVYTGRQGDGCMGTELLHCYWSLDILFEGRALISGHDTNF